MTSQGLWDSLTAEQYVQIVGTASDDIDAVRQVVATGKHLGELLSLLAAHDSVG